MESSFLFMSATDTGFFRGTKTEFLKAIKRTWPNCRIDQQDGSIHVVLNDESVGEFYVYYDLIQDIPEKLV